ncbi:E3 ubiquitin/ISG15 ligase TRIM25 [Anabarilius grahami]|uniref:E3 ubiquitin/ISG15 ligase TRIM25 n=1 Tax=Anabarilius grahami TaxID=495550 RepID=A0A3N0XMY8_ANAGA|nr:E3 ubiquitin/ISG15 ligase TRIM25 [Anabarilius grahami]
MAESVFDPEGSLNCLICLDLLKEPVTTSCGHSFCMDCIKRCWDLEFYRGFFSCPTCRTTFNQRPALSKTKVLADILEGMKREAPAGPGDVTCDVCKGRKVKAIRSCLVCMASYCRTHVRPHYEPEAFKIHKLVKASPNLQQQICPQHHKALEVYCHDDQKCIFVVCMGNEHSGHKTVSAADAMAKKQEELKVKKRDFIQKTNDIDKEVQQFKKSAVSYKHSAQAAVEHSDKIFSEIICSIQKRQAEVRENIRAQENKEVRDAENHIQTLEKEICELQEENRKLEPLLQTEDHVYFFQHHLHISRTAACATSCMPASTPPPRRCCPGRGLEGASWNMSSGCWCPVIDDDTSPTSYPVPSQQHSDCEDRQPEPTAGNESHSAATYTPAQTRATELNIALEPEQRVPDQSVYLSVSPLVPFSPELSVSPLVPPSPVFPPNLPHPLPLQHSLDSVFCFGLSSAPQFLPQSPAIPVAPSSMPPLSGEATPWALWESSGHGCEKPLAPPSASACSSPPQSEVPTPAPTLLPPSMPAETVGLSASQDSLSTSAPPGSGIAPPTPRTYGPVATLRPSTPSSLASSSLPQAPPPPSVAPARLQPSGSLPSSRGVVTTAMSRPSRSSESLHYIGSLASRWASSLVSPSPPVVPMAAPVVIAPWLLPPVPRTRLPGGGGSVTVTVMFCLFWFAFCHVFLCSVSRHIQSPWTLIGPCPLVNLLSLFVSVYLSSCLGTLDVLVYALDSVFLPADYQVKTYTLLFHVVCLLYPHP